MNTILLSDKKEDIMKAAQILKRGGLVAIPTETVYGLAANALCAESVKKIFAAKKRPADNPLIVHIAEISDIEKFGIVKSFPEKAQKLAERFWPGPLTIVLEKTDVVPNEISCGLNTVAVRIPKNETARNVIIAAKCPLAAPSANSSGRPSPTTAQHVFEDLNGKIDAVLDGGACEIGVESTVVSLIGAVPVLLRPGGVTVREIEEVIGKIKVSAAITEKVDNEKKVESPGMKHTHYAPKVKLILIDGTAAEFIKYVNSQPNSACLCSDDEFSKISCEKLSLGEHEDYNTNAQRLFSALREIEKTERITQIFARLPAQEGIGLALYNRMIRAAGFRIIKVPIESDD